jgi:Xaa-Pro aminopeptidase
MPHHRRRARLGEALSGAGLDGVLVSHLLNVRYLTGFTGSAGHALLGADGSCVVATDSRYELQVADECPDVEALITRQGQEQLAERAAALGWLAVAYEDVHLSVADWRALTADGGDRWRPAGRLVEDLRVVKDDIELDALRTACAVSDAALAAVMPTIVPGVTERQVARWIDDALRVDGSEGPGFDTIVAAGPWGAVPHHQPSDYVIASGDLVTIDFGARVDGYHADMTRTLLVGPSRDAWQLEVYGLVQAAQAAGVAALSATTTPALVDEAARQVIADGGMGEYFTHGLGHGVGLQIHEAPFLGSTSTDKLGPSVPVTVEPGIYVPGRGGVRIEDTVVVHADRVERLTTTTRDLVELG